MFCRKPEKSNGEQREESTIGRSVKCQQCSYTSDLAERSVSCPGHVCTYIRVYMSLSPARYGSVRGAA